MANAKQLKALRKKYGLGEFKRSANKRKKVSGGIMAKRRKGRYSRRSGSKGISTNIYANLIGVGGYIAYESLGRPYVVKYVGNDDLMSVAEIVAGVYLSKNKNMIVSNVAKTAIVINTYKLMNKYVAPMVLGQLGGSSSTTTLSNQFE